MAKELNLEQHRVMFEKDDERPFSGKYWDTGDHGLYSCGNCGAELFLSLSKFNAGGWPSFKSPIDKERFVEGLVDEEGRKELSCKKCRAHLGYLVGDDTPEQKPYYQINSASLLFTELPEIELPEKEGETGEEGGGDRDVEGRKGKKESTNTTTKTQMSVPSWPLAGVGLVLGALLGGGVGVSMCTPFFAELFSNVATTTVMQTQTIETQTIVGPIIVTEPAPMGNTGAGAMGGGGVPASGSQNSGTLITEPAPSLPTKGEGISSTSPDSSAGGVDGSIQAP